MTEKRHTKDKIKIAVKKEASVSTDVSPSPDEKVIVSGNEKATVSTDLSSSPDAENVQPEPQTVRVSADIASSADEKVVVGSGEKATVSTEVISSPDAENVQIEPKSVQIGTEISPSADEIVLTQREKPATVSTEVIPSSDAENIQPKPKMIQVSTEVIPSPDEVTKAIKQDIEFKPDIIIAPDKAGEYQKFEDDFSGQWLPKGDPVRIGVKNYSTLENFRYTDFGFEGVGGYTRINTNTTARTLTNGIQLKTNYDQESYILAQGTLSGSSSLIMSNTGTVPETGNFDVYEWLIDNTNNILHLQSYLGIPSDDVYLVIDQTTYASGQALANNIQSKANANADLTDSGTLTFGVAYNTTTYKFTISVSVGGGTVKYKDSGSTLGDTIGFTEDTSYGSSITSDTAADNDNPLIIEDGDAELARFSLLPNGQVGICDEKNNYIWAGDEMPCAAFMLFRRRSSSLLFSEIADFTHDYTDRINNSLTDSGNTVTISNIYKSFGDATTRYDVTKASAPVTYRYTRDDGTQPEFVTNGLTVGDVIAIESTAFVNDDNEGDFKVKTVAETYFEVENEDGVAEGNVISGDADGIRCYGTGFIVGSTRRLTSINIDISSANTSSATLLGYTFADSTSLAALTISDGTASGGKTLAVDGTITFTANIANATPALLEGKYLFWYIFYSSTDAFSATIANITCNADLTYNTTIYSLWDGMPRTAILCKVYDDSDTANPHKDYTLENARESSFTQFENSEFSNHYGIDVSSFEADKDYIDLIFEEPVNALKIKMLQGSIAGALNLLYNNNGTWVTRTLISNEGDLPRKSGVYQWAKPSKENKITIDGIEGYAYRIFAPVVNLSAGTIIDTIQGIPSYREIKKLYKFPFQSKNRAMWCNCLSDKEYNRVDYSMTNAPDVYNGYDASGTHNERSLYFGDSKALIGAVELYNEYGNTVETISLFFKDNETYMLLGDNPENFRILKISDSIGCPAPLSIVSAEVAYRSENAPEQNIVLWLSDKGPMMFIGNTIRAIPGIEPYFDPNDSNYVGASYISEARGWYDHTYREYNLIVPNGDDAEDIIWFVYDLVRQKWFTKSPTIDYPAGAITVEDTNGIKYNYGYTSTGYLLRLENGYEWVDDDNIIENKIKSADMILSGNLWEESTARQIKVVFEDNDEGVITIRYYKNGNPSPTQGIVTVSGSEYGCLVTHKSASDAVFATDQTAGLWSAAALTYQTTDVDDWAQSTNYSAMPAELSMAETDNYRYRHLLYNINFTGFSHSFEIIINGCTEKKPKLLGWGVTFDTQEDFLDRGDKQS